MEGGWRSKRLEEGRGKDTIKKDNLNSGRLYDTSNDKVIEKEAILHSKRSHP